MKHLLLMLACVVLAVCAAIPVAAQDLKKLGLDDASAVGLKLLSDRAVKVEGAASLRIETPWPTSVCLGEVSGVEVEGARLVYRARVKTDLEGEAFLEMWVHVAGGQYFSRGLDQPVKGKADWRTVQTPFMLQKGQRPEKITLNLVVNGKGTVWVDDVVLAKAPLK